MLKPFTIANLFVENARLTEQSNTHFIPARNHHCLVKVSAEEYDAAILECPDAKLQYADDDGETITIGSSLELIQRLDEPFEPRDPKTGRIYKFTPDNSLHQFSINRTPSAIKIWEAFEARRLRPDICTDKKADGIHIWDHIPGFSPHDILEGVHGSFFEADLILNSPSGDNPEPSPGNSVLQESKQVVGPTSPAGSIATASQKNASQDPGSAPPPLCRTLSVGSDSEAPKLTEGGLTEREPRSQESPIDEKQQSFFEAFEIELLKIVDQDAQPASVLKTEACAPAADESKPSPSTTEQGPDTSSIPKAAELIAQSLQSVLSSLNNTLSQLGMQIPEIEKRLIEAQNQTQPDNVEAVIQEGINSVRNQVQRITKTVLEATHSTRDAIGHRRHAELLNRAQSEFTEMGKLLFVALGSKASTLGITREPLQIPLFTQDEDGEKGTQTSGTSTNCPTAGQPLTVRPATSPKTLFIGNLNPITTEESIQNYLMDRGFLGDVKLPKDAVSRENLGFGYISFPSDHAATGALNALKESLINGHKTNVEYSQGIPAEDIGEPSSEGAPPPPPPKFVNTHKSQPHCVHSRRKGVNKTALDLRRRRSLASQISNNNQIAHGPNGRLERSLTDIRPAHLPSHHRVTWCDGPVLPNPSFLQGPSLLDAQDPDGDFSARYPPLSTILGRPLSPAPVRQAETQDDHYPIRAATPDLPRLTSNSFTPSLPLSTAASAVNPSHLPSTSQIETPGAWPGAPTSELRPLPLPCPYGAPTLSDLTQTPLPVPDTSSAREEADSYQSYAPGPPVPYPGLGPLYSPPGTFPLEPQRLTSSPTAPHTSTDSPLSPDQFPSIRACVDHLVALGYVGYPSGNIGGLSRLWVYAEAAEGNLNDAIEMIEEERKVYEQHLRQY